jgi:hypothetical protein
MDWILNSKSGHIRYDNRLVSKFESFEIFLPKQPAFWLQNMEYYYMPLQHFHAALFHPIARIMILVVHSIFWIKLHSIWGAETPDNLPFLCGTYWAGANGPFLIFFSETSADAVSEIYAWERTRTAPPLRVTRWGVCNRAPSGCSTNSAL